MFCFLQAPQPDLTRFRRVIGTITSTRSPAERITDSPKDDATSTPRERSAQQHVDDTFCSDKLFTKGSKYLSPLSHVGPGIDSFFYHVTLVRGIRNSEYF